MTTLNSGQLLNQEGVAARCTLFMGIRYSYRACSAGSHHAAISKFSTEKLMDEVVKEWEFPEGW